MSRHRLNGKADVLRLELPVRAEIERERDQFALLYFSPDAEA